MPWVSDEDYEELMKLKDEYRDNISDLKYYNSDLNKFIGKEMPKIMTSIDLDLYQYKKSTGVMRKGEYKHSGEKIGKQQLDLLKTQAKIDKYLNGVVGWDRFETCVVWGTYPFESIDVWDIVNDKKENLNGEDVEKFLTLEHKQKHG